VSYAAGLTRVKRSSRCTYWTARRTDGGAWDTVMTAGVRTFPIAI